MPEFDEIANKLHFHFGRSFCAFFLGFWIKLLYLNWIRNLDFEQVFVCCLVWLRQSCVTNQSSTAERNRHEFNRGILTTIIKDRFSYIFHFGEAHLKGIPSVCERKDIVAFAFDNNRTNQTKRRKWHIIHLRRRRDPNRWWSCCWPKKSKPPPLRAVFWASAAAAAVGLANYFDVIQWTLCPALVHWVRWSLATMSVVVMIAFWVSLIYGLLDRRRKLCSRKR